MTEKEKKYTPEYFREKGRKGGLATLKKHGVKHYKKINRLAEIKKQREL